MTIKGHPGLAHKRRKAQLRTKCKGRFRHCEGCGGWFRRWVRGDLQPVAERHMCKRCFRVNYLKHGCVAQGSEPRSYKSEVAGSIPAATTNEGNSHA